MLLSEMCCIQTSTFKHNILIQLKFSEYSTSLHSPPNRLHSTGYSVTAFCCRSDGTEEQNKWLNEWMHELYMNDSNFKCEIPITGILHKLHLNWNGIEWILINLLFEHSRALNFIWPEIFEWEKCYNVVQEFISRDSFALHLLNDIDRHSNTPHRRLYYAPVQG